MKQTRASKVLAMETVSCTRSFVLKTRTFERCSVKVAWFAVAYAPEAEVGTFTNLPLCQGDQTTAYVLQRCPFKVATREDVWRVSTPMATTLYGCKQEVKKTASFITRPALNLKLANAKKKRRVFSPKWQGRTWCSTKKRAEFVKLQRHCWQLFGWLLQLLPSDQ